MKAAVLRAIVAAVGLAMVAVMLVDWNAIVWLGGPQATNDVQTRSDPVFLMSQVPGYVTADAVNDDEQVHKGQVLFRIEDDVYRAERDRAAAAEAEAKATVDVLQAQIGAAGAAIDATRATVSADTATLTYARQEQGRWNALAGTAGDLLQERQRANAQARSQNEAVTASQSEVAAAISTRKELQQRLGAAEAMLQSRHHALELAEITLGWTHIIAPADGVVARRDVFPGQFVEAGRRLITFVPVPDAWLVAWYREEQVVNMRVGQKVDIHIDAFPAIIYHGHVDSFAPETQAWSQLLPPDRATGNFTKVVQRVPVKILFDAPIPDYARIVPGLSVETDVHTEGASNQGPR